MSEGDHSLPSHLIDVDLNPELDRLIELAQVEPDEKKRKSYYDAAVKIIADEAPAAAVLHDNKQKIFAK